MNLINSLLDTILTLDIPAENITDAPACLMADIDLENNHD